MIKLIFETTSGRGVHRVIRKRTSVTFSVEERGGDHSSVVIRDERNRLVASSYDLGAGWNVGNTGGETLRIEES